MVEQTVQTVTFCDPARASPSNQSARGQASWRADWTGLSRSAHELPVFKLEFVKIQLLSSPSRKIPYVAARWGSTNQSRSHPWALFVAPPALPAPMKWTHLELSGDACVDRARAPRSVRPPTRR